MNCLVDYTKWRIVISAMRCSCWLSHSISRTRRDDDHSLAYIISLLQIIKAFQYSGYAKIYPGNREFSVLLLHDYDKHNRRLLVRLSVCKTSSKCQYFLLSFCFFRSVIRRHIGVVDMNKTCTMISHVLHAAWTSYIYDRWLQRKDNQGKLISD